ncbi:MAG TPA: LamG-like jellyroll fold domain-containing protein [Candidatus Saccharimonadales bacterium]|nr:LamG-like jellyroll fold domain-containing protein [Candidatus Saccharimonadales bacterium]
MGKQIGAVMGVFVLLLQYMVLLAPAQQAGATPVTSPLHVSTDNSRYFADSSNNPVYLTGSHTWLNLVDAGNGTPPPQTDYDDYLDFVENHDGNFFRLWTWEQARWSNETTDADYWFDPLPYNRVSGHGTANDGENKFDLTSLNQDYFDRLRERVEDAGDRGMYVAVMLFQGWSTECKGSGGSCGIYYQPFDGHPYNAANNINSIDGDIDNDGDGEETHHLADQDVTDLQEAYVQKVVDTVGDLDNVLYEICNECGGGSDNRDWQYHMVDFVHSYEDQEFSINHPVGMTMQWPNANVTSLTNSNAEWISFGGNISAPPVNDGTKVVIGDTDHVCGVCVNNEWPWKALLRGQNTTHMDVYDGAGYGTGAGSIGDKRSDASWNNMRDNMGKSKEWASRMNLKLAVPSTTISSTQFALVNNGTAASDEYLVFAPSGGSSFTVDLSSTSGNLDVEWLNIETLTTSGASPVAGGSSSQSFTPPSSDTHILSLRQDGTAPAVSITAPGNSATVSGSSVSVTATASDNVGVVGVQFKLDGNNLGAEDTSSPYAITWDSTAASEGAHTLTAVARDAATNQTTSTTVNVTVDNYQGLVAAYGFNNATTPRADASGNAYTLDCGTNCPTHTTTGGHSSSGAYDFSGTNNWLEIPTESPFDFTTNMTVEFWFKSPGWTKSWEQLVAKGDSAWSVSRYVSYDTIDFSTFNGSTYIDNHAGLTETYDDNAWHHAAMTYDGTNKKVYVDGTLKTTYGYSQTLNNNSYKVSLGHNLEFTTAEFGGLIDDVRIYNRALNSTEIASDMATPVN